MTCFDSHVPHAGSGSRRDDPRRASGAECPHCGQPLKVPKPPSDDTASDKGPSSPTTSHGRRSTQTGAVAGRVPPQDLPPTSREPLEPELIAAPISASDDESPTTIVIDTDHHATTADAAMRDNPKAPRRRTTVALWLVGIALVACTGFIWRFASESAKKQRREAAVPELERFGVVDDDALEFTPGVIDVSSDVTPSEVGTMNLDDVIEKALPHIRQGDVVVIMLPPFSPGRAATLTDKSLEGLSTTESLQVLGVQNTSVTDEGIKHVAKMPRLKMLDIGGTRVTDSCLASLSGHGTLELVIATNTGLSREAVESFNQSNSTVIWADWNHPGKDSPSSFRSGYVTDTKRREVTVSFSESPW